MLKLVGILVAIAVGLAALWLLVDMAIWAWSGVGALVFAFVLVIFLFYLADRRKIKQSEDLIADRRGLG